MARNRKEQRATREIPGTSLEVERNKNGRNPIPEALERVRVEHTLSESRLCCPECHTGLKCIGQETSEQLDFIPSRLIVRKHIRYNYGCPCCKGHVVTAPLPPQPIDKALAGSGLLTEILINKYQDVLPLYRQQQRWERLGYRLSCSTLCDWAMACSKLITTGLNELSNPLLLAGKASSSQAPIRVLSMLP